jgi:hypothetical protein
MKHAQCPDAGVGAVAPGEGRGGSWCCFWHRCHDTLCRNLLPSPGPLGSAGTNRSASRLSESQAGSLHLGKSCLSAHAAPRSALRPPSGMSSNPGRQQTHGALPLPRRRMVMCGGRIYNINPRSPRAMPSPCKDVKADSGRPPGFLGPCDARSRIAFSFPAPTSERGPVRHRPRCQPQLQSMAARRRSPR